MPAFAPIVINDGQAVPVAHTFAARRLVDGIAKWQDVSSGIALGFPTITASVREPVKGSKIPTYRVEIDFWNPKMETVNASTYNGITPAPTKAYDCIGKLTLLLPERSTTNDRKDLRAYIANALAHADVKSLIEDLAMVY